MLAFNRDRNGEIKIKKLTTAGRFNTYICGWLIEDRNFLCVIDETTLVQIFDKLISLIDMMADELESRFGENGFAVEQEKKIRKNATHLRLICHNFRSYGLMD
jgi:hypothetical protein